MEIPSTILFVRAGKNAELVLNIPVSTQYRMIKDGDLPKPIRLSERMQGWSTDVLREFFVQKAKEQGAD